MPEGLELSPLKHPLKYIRIHGITFLADEIVRIFHNTPLASAVALGSNEYDPPWLTLTEVKSVRDMLCGMIMPYAFYMSLSLEAYINMSGDDTFLKIYEAISRDGELDRWFILGMRMLEWLRLAWQEIIDTKEPIITSNNMDAILSLTE